MRKAQLQVEPVAGRRLPAHAGGLRLSRRGRLGRRERQAVAKPIPGPDGNPPKIESKTVKGKNVEVTRVETSGRYKPAPIPGVAPEPEREKATLLGAIVVTDRVGYFLKMVGPDKTMAKVRPAFDELLSSIEVEDK